MILPAFEKLLPLEQTTKVVSDEPTLLRSRPNHSISIETALCILFWLAVAGCAAPPTPNELFERSYPQAVAGDASAQETIAYLYMTGRGVERNPDLARRWYVASARQGNALARAALSELGIDSIETPFPTGEQGHPADQPPLDAHIDAVPVLHEPRSDSVVSFPDSREPETPTSTLPPRIVVSDHFSTRKHSLTILGQVLSDSPIREVTVNGKRASIEPDGRFGARLSVIAGKSRVEISATDTQGRSARAFVSISRFDHHDSEADRFRSGIEFGRFHALLIGNNEYSQLHPLTTAIYDVDAIATLLADDYGYEVQILYNATRTQIRFALSSYRETLSESDNLLIYYAGHGTMDDRAAEAYWLPVDASLGIDTNWISNATLSATLRAIDAKHVIVIADSCYSGTLVRGTTARDHVESYLERELREIRIRRMNEKRSRTALSSGANEPVVDSGKNGHSVFANALLSTLKANTDVLSATDLYIAVRRSVMLQADQSPQYGDIRMAGHEAGDFLFVRIGSGSPSNSAALSSQ